MRWQEIGNMTCSIGRALSVVGDRWTLLIMRDAFGGVRRFEDFQADLGVTRHVLADRLRKLGEHGVLEKVQYQDRPPRHEYRLTEKGLDLHSVMMALTAWGDRWMHDEDGAPLLMIHKGCGEAMHAVSTCSACGEPIAAHDITAQPGPGMTDKAEVESRLE